MSKLKTLLIGEGALLVRCGDVLISRGHRISGVVSSDELVRSWASKAGIKHFEQDRTQDVISQDTQFDILFSIGNFSIIPDALLKCAKRMSINYHYGPLPEYSGLHVPSWAIYEQADEYAVCWHRISDVVDGGNILKRQAVAIEPHDTTLQLELKCDEAAFVGFNGLIEDLETGREVELPQDLASRRYFSRLSQFPAEGLIDWNEGAQSIDAHVRATDYGPFSSPMVWPKVVINNQFYAVRGLIVGESVDGMEAEQLNPGEVVVHDDTSGLSIATPSNFIHLTKLSTLEGEVLHVEDVVKQNELVSGTTLVFHDEVQGKALTQAGVTASKSTGFWQQNLLRFNPYRLPQLTAPESSHTLVDCAQSVDIKLEVNPQGIPFEVSFDEYVTAGFATFLAKAQGTEQVHISLNAARDAVETAHRDLFASWLPLNISVDFENPVAQNIEQICLLKRKVESKGLLRRDLIGRTPELSSRFADGQIVPDIVVSTAESCSKGLMDEQGPAIELLISSEKAQVELYFNANKITAAQAQRLAEQFKAFNAQLPSLFEQPLIDTCAASEQEKAFIAEFNATEQDGSDKVLFHGMFETAAESYADNIALLCADNQRSYQDLNKQANQFAHFLQAKGVNRGDLVGVCLDRSIDLVVALLAVLKTGAAYVPVDPKFPLNRIQQMVSDANPVLLITETEIPQSLREWSSRCVNLEDVLSENSHLSDNNLNVEIAADDLAYVIYTSGSTGRPKGVEVTHANLCNFLSSMQIKPGCSETDRLLAVTTISFDIAALELFLPLSCGAGVVIAQPQDTMDGQALLNLMQQHTVTMMQATPATWNLLLQSGWTAKAQLNKILCGGEILSHKLAKQLSGHCDSLWNMYGPTETTIWSSCGLVDVAADITIGSPIANTQLHVLDSNLQPVPFGFAGELYIGGTGVARGYHNAPELTEAAFIANPFGEGRLYRTGDLAMFKGEGKLVILGRNDGQIKMRGYRIELGEVEAAIGNHDEIASTVVVGRKDQLVAYCVRNAATTTDAAQSRQIANNAVKEWRGAWDNAYEHHAEDPTFNTSGWNNSYDGQHFANDEMRDWQAASVNRILSYQPRKIFEIGCGTGLMLHALASEVEAYHAIDASSQAVDLINQHIHALPNVTCEHHAADELPQIEAGSFDTVVINSVAQYFPNQEYLVSVLDWAAKTVENGRIFIGDVRNLELLKVFHADLVQFKAHPGTDEAELKRRVEQSVKAERELVLSPEFFARLQGILPNIGKVEVALRDGNYTNEMSRYRFDVVLHVGDVQSNEKEALQLQWADIDTNEKPVLTALGELLQNGETQIRLSNIANGRLADVFERVGSIIGANVQNNQWVDLRDLNSVAEQNGFDVALLPAQSGDVWQCDAVFYKKGVTPQLSFELNAEQNDKDIAQFANIPTAGIPARPALNRFLPTWLEGRLPGFMVPDFFVELDELPLTPNGKIDRKALPDPIEQTVEATVRPTNELEQQILSIWSDVLGHDRISVNASFFKIGGNSLRVVQVQSALQELLGRPISTSVLYEFFTIKSLAAHLVGNDQQGGKEVVKRRSAHKDEGIAIVSMSCRLPGQVNDPKELWELLERGGDGIVDVPEDRWDANAIYDADPEARGKSYCRKGGFVYPIDLFDAAFFGISPREARALDPAQRMMLETAWEAFEKAGYTMDQLRGSQTGVFIGIGKGYHEYGLATAGGLDDLDGYFGTGSAGATMSGRVSYSFGLEGPSLTVDTACSSSLVATHQACNALRDGECDLALAAGITLMLSPDLHIEFSRLRGMSPDGRCKSFSSTTDGTGWSEGSAVVVLKRLSDAQRDGDNIHAIIRGTSVNHAGHSASLTTPSGPAQQRVIRQALANSNVEPAEIDYLEAHGTGTKLGDPIEATSLAAVFGGSHSEENPLWVGSIKSNLGHTQAAAGLAGVMKAVMAMEHNKLPRTIHVEEPTPSIDWQAQKMALVLEEQPWQPNANRPRRAGVSSFGIGGTNSHVVLEEPPKPVVNATKSAPTPELLPFVLSGFTENALRAQADKLHFHMGMNIQDSFGDVAYSLATQRTHFRKRIVLMSKDKSHLLDDLASFSRTGETPAGAIRISDNAQDEPQLAMLFTGQGSQLAKMGHQLYGVYPAFKQAVDEIAGKFNQLEKPLLDVMFAQKGSDDAKLLDRTDFTQPALFTLEVALWRLWDSWGVKPNFVMGHSIGEIAAAHVAGVFSLEDATRLVAARGRLMQALPAGGGMASLEATGSEVEEAIKQLDMVNTINIAGYNSPQQTVVSGAESDIEKVVAHFEKLERKARKLVVSHAFHSYLLDDMLDNFRAVAESINFNAPKMLLVSTLTGELAEAEAMTTAQYWVQQARQAVKFEQGMQTLKNEGANIFLELGPQPVLSGLGAACLDGDSSVAWVPSLNKEQQDGTLMQKSLAQLHVLGVSVDWKDYFTPFGGSVVELPTYAFQREHFWIEESSDRSVGAGLTETNHMLLGGSTQIAGTDMHIFSTVVGADEPIWVKEHQVMDAILMPGTAFIEAMRVAGNKVDNNDWDIADVMIMAPMILTKGNDVKMQVTIGAASDGARSVQVFSSPEDNEGPDSWQLHAEGRLVAAKGVKEAHSALPPAGAQKMDVSSLYEDLADLGYGYGPTFQGITEAYHVGGEVWAKVSLPESAESSAIRYGLHPALLDSAMHSLLLTQRLANQSSDDVFVPFEAERLSMATEGLAHVWVRVQSFEMGEGEFWASLDLYDFDGNSVGRLERLHARKIDRAALRRMAVAGVERYQFDINWQKVEVEMAEPQGTWGLLGCGEVEWMEDVRTALEEKGLQAIDVWSLDEAAYLDGVICLWESEDGSRDSDDSVTGHAHEISHRGLAQLHELSESEFAAPVVWVTRSAIGTSNDDPVERLGCAALWGLARTARNEYPDLKLRTIDLSENDEDLQWMMNALMQEAEPEMAIRHGQVMVPQIDKSKGSNELVVPAEGMWHLEIATKGRLDEPLLVKPDVEESLAGGEVRIEVKATGVNFLDVLNALGMVEIPAFGLECAGVVTHVGSSVKHVAVGDAVMGLSQGSFASHVVTDARQIVKMPENLSFEEAATIPMTFLTAWYGLHVLGSMQSGEKVLIHAAAGGVGMAAVQLAQLHGAEVFATASEPKWDALRAMGLDDDHIASSRDLNFVEHFGKLSPGKSFNIVLNSLAREFIDASLGMLGPDSRFLEMGKIDLREQSWIDEHYPGVTYSVYNLPEAGPDCIQEMLQQLVPLFAEGKLQPLRLKTYPMNQASDALRFIAQAKHIGKVVLTPPKPQRLVDPEGAVLITGGVGGLGRYMAKWLATEHGVKDFVLTSRRGMETSGAPEFVAELAELDVKATVVACDAADYNSLKNVMSEFNDERPLRGVAHTAGVLDDGMLSAMDEASLDKVYSPKVDGGWNLHLLTREMDLDFFVMFSSVSGVMGTLGQGNYAAANSFLDALAYHRRSKGLPASSIAWGAWDGQGMATRLSDADKARYSKQGMDPLAPEEGTELFETCVASGRALTVAAAFDMGRLQRSFEEQAGEAPALYRTIFKSESADAGNAGSTSGSGGKGLRKALAKAQPEEYEAIVLQMVRNEVAKVLEFSSGDDVDPSLGLQDIGIDSLTAVLMRNQLSDMTGLALPAKVAFDHPNLNALSKYLVERLVELGIESADEEEQSVVEEIVESTDAEVSGLKLVTDGSLATELQFDNVEDINDEPEAIFLTGSTGFVGAFLLDRLLQSGKDIYCLVRADSDEHGAERIKESLDAYGMWKEEYADLVQPIVGDLDKPMFGLAEDTFEWLADSVDSICHAGAIVDWMMPLDTYLPTNVGGTHEALRLAANGRGKQLHYISTYATLPKYLGYTIEQSHVDYGYLTSKFMGEQMVAAAQWRGAKASVYRLPFIGACNQTGRFRRDRGDYLHNLIAGCVDLGLFPALDGDLRGLISVDYMADVIAKVILEDGERIGRHYDFVNAQAPTIKAYVDLVNEAGVESQMLPFEQWQEKALAKAKEDKEGSMARISSLLEYLSQADLEEMLQGYPVGRDVFGDTDYPCPQTTVQSIAAYIEQIKAAE